MNLDLSVSESIEINCSTEKMWDVLTNPEIIKEYLFGTETITDWKVGSEIVFQGEYQGQKYHDKGKILENQSQKLISYSYWSAFTGLEDLPENYSIITMKVELIEKKKCKFTWTQKGFATDTGLEHSKSNLASMLGQIKIIAEK